MRSISLTIAAACLLSPAWADQGSQFLCIEPLEFSATKPINPYEIHGVSFAETANNTIISLGDPFVSLDDPILNNTMTGFIRGTSFIPLEGHHPEYREVDDIYATGTRERIGLFGFIGARELWQQNPRTGEFSRLRIHGFSDEPHLRSAGWSTPLNALLLARGGARNPPGADLYALQDGEIRLIEDIPEWVTQIIDFPEIEMTFLSTEYENRIYLIDANQHVHDLGTRASQEWVFVNDVVLLPNPPRLLIDMEEALGAFRGRFVLRLEQRNGVWVPSDEQDTQNVYKDYDSFLDEGLRGVAPDLLVNFSALRGRSDLEIPGPGQTKFQRSSTTRIYMPATQIYVVLGENTIRAFDQSSGKELQIHGARIDISKYFWARNAVYLTDRAELLIAAKNGYFLLSDSLVETTANCP